MTTRDSLSKWVSEASPGCCELKLHSIVPGHNTCVFRVLDESNAWWRMEFSYTLYLDIIPIIMNCYIRMANIDENAALVSSISMPVAEYTQFAWEDTDYGLAQAHVAIVAQE